MKKLLQLLCLCLLLISGSVKAQTKLGSYFYKVPTPAPVPSYTGSNNNINSATNTSIEAAFIANGVSNLTLSRGAGLAHLNNSTYSYVGSLPDGQNEAAAVANDVYYQVAVNSTSGNYTSFSGIKAILRTANISGSVSEMVSKDITSRWYYSLNGTNFIPIGNEVLVGNTATGGAEQAQIDLSNIVALQNINPNQTVYFRLYAWGANGGSINDRGFGFGKSNTSGLEILSFFGATDSKPILSSWEFSKNHTNTGKWPEYQTDPAGYPGAQPSTYNHPFIETVSVARGAGLNLAGLFYSYAATSAKTTTLTYEEAKADNSYFSLTVKPKASYAAILKAISFKYRLTTTTGPKNYRWTFIKDGGAIVELGSADGLATLNGGEGEFQPTTDLSTVPELQGLTSANTVEFRLYVWGSSTTASIFAFGRFASADTSPSLILNGVAVTEQALPVTLSSFQSTKQNNAVRLNWVTTSEKDNSHFNVLRAGDDKKFTSIAKVNGNGSTNVSKEYTLTDYKPLAGANYYKLSQTDLNGNVHEIGEMQYAYFDLNNSSLTVLHGTETAVVKANLTANKADQATIAVYNVSGNSLYQANKNINNGVNQIEVPVQFQKGMYILKVTTKNGEVWQSKFIR
ncbi:hypothetical protein D3C87_369700 [compost metagenome]